MHSALSQETPIRILGVYPTHLSLDQGRINAHLAAVRSAWNATGLPAASGVTLDVLNNAVAVPVNYPNISSNPNIASQEAVNYLAIRNMRAAWQADVIIVYGAFDPCGTSQAAWGPGPNGAFVPNAQGLDLRKRNIGYVSVVNPVCEPIISAHEFGHLGGGGHASSPSMYPDSRAYVQYYYDPDIFFELYEPTALFDPTDCPAECPGSVSTPSWPVVEYSRNEPLRGDANHSNKNALATTARSLANFYEYPPAPPVLKPPVNLNAVNRGCIDGLRTRWDLYWANHPDTTAAVTHYDIWKSQPTSQPYVYGWTVYSTFSDSYLIGANARWRVNACSGGTCSELSPTSVEVFSMCSGG
jgi:hypothetical protein